MITARLFTVPELFRFGWFCSKVLFCLLFMETTHTLAPLPLPRTQVRPLPLVLHYNNFMQTPGPMHRYIKQISEVILQ